MKLIIVFLLLQAPILFGKGPYRSKCQNVGKFSNTDVDQSIDMGLLEVHQVSSSVQCAFECVANSKCLSYNYEHGSSSPSHTCELVDTTKKEALLTARPGYTHYEMAQLNCGGMECLNGGSCIQDCVTGIESCLCTAGFDGANCSIGVQPRVEIHPKSQAMKENETAIIDCYSSRAEKTKWIKDGYYIDILSNDHLTLLQNGSLEIRDFTSADDGDYYCTVFNPTGSTTSGSAFVGITPIPTAKTLYNRTKLVSQFYGSIGIEMSKFTTVDAWFKDDVQIDFATATSTRFESTGRIAFVGAKKSDEGYYHFTASNSLGTTVSNKIEVKVIIMCPALVHPTNGIRRGPRLEGDITSFHCKFKYTLVGEENLECLTDGTWSAQPPTCVADASNSHSVRLVALDSSVDNEGRVEIYSGGKWGSVGDKNWDIDDAKVVCKELGFPSALDIIRHLPSDHHKIFLNDVQCTGTEARLAACTADYDTMYSSPMKIAGVVCQNVRLAGGGFHFGRVEVYTGGRWGTVCDDQWDMLDTQVVCRQLGFQYPKAFGNNQGAGTGDIVLDNLACAGREKSITHCEHIRQHNCAHSEDISITCIPIRLLGSPNYQEGRLEHRYNGKWRTACDDSWGDQEANVVCRQLGYPGYIRAVGSAFFGQGTGSILFDNTACTGSETSIITCPRGSTHNCGHSEDAGVVCQAHVRLAGSSNYYEGRVEAYKDGTWGTVCDHLWDIRDAHVVCRMLGFNGAAEVYKKAHFGQGTGTVHHDGLQCDGTESRILHCPKSPSGSCTHANDAGVKCRVLRLADGDTRNEGRVEIFKDNTWGTVCGPITAHEAGVRICLEISRGNYRYKYSNPYTYGEGTGDIKMSNLNCTGSEYTIFDCPYSTDISSCTHANDISIRCNSGVRIMATNDDSRGAVQVYRQQRWSPVCANEWDIRDAGIACRRTGGLDVIEATVVPRDTNPATRGGFQCEGYEKTLEDCRQETVPSTCTQDAGVVCQTLRLAQGSAPHIGLLQVYRFWAWGGVCEHEWDKRDAHVACIQLGFPSGVDTTHRVPAAKARSGGYNWMTIVYCNGYEKNIHDCPATYTSESSCANTEEVWVECIP